MNNAKAYYITDDQLIQEGPGLLYGFLHDCSADGGVITIYDGLNTQSGRIIFHASGWQYDDNDVILANPIPFEQGLYVVLDANVSDATLLVEPQRSYSPPKVQDVLDQLANLLASIGG